MSIDTEIKGEPDTITGAATWLSGSLGSAVADAGTATEAVTRVPDWSGATATSVTGWAAQAARSAEQIGEAATTVATTLTTFAVALRQAQREMKRICQAASAADLEVSGFVIADPGAGPGRPAPLPTGVAGLRISAQSLGRHADAVAAFEAHEKKVAAYRTAQREAEAARDRIEGAAAALSSGGMDEIGAALKVAGTGLAGFSAYASQKSRNLLAANRAAYDYHADRLLNHGDEFASRRIHDNVKARRTLIEGADRFRRVVRPLDLALQAGSLANDLKSDKPVEEIIGGKIGGVLGGVGGAAGAGALTGGNPLAAAAGGAGGSAGGEYVGEKVAGPVVDGAQYVGDHPYVAGPAMPVVVAVTHVDDAVEVVRDAPGAVVGAAEDVGSFLNPLD